MPSRSLSSSELLRLRSAAGTNNIHSGYGGLIETAASCQIAIIEAMLMTSRHRDTKPANLGAVT